MRKLATRGIATAEAIGNHETFVTYGALSASQRNSAPAYLSTYVGRLNQFERMLFEQVAAHHGISYIVFSYATPIAWVDSRGNTRVVDQKFSVTTTKHQGNLYKLSNVRDNEFWQSELEAALRCNEETGQWLHEVGHSCEEVTA